MIRDICRRFVSRIQLAPVVLVFTGLLSSCGGDRPLGLRDAPCKSDRDCVLPYVCARATATCQWSDLAADAAPPGTSSLAGDGAAAAFGAGTIDAPVPGADANRAVGDVAALGADASRADLATPILDASTGVPDVAGPVIDANAMLAPDVAAQKLDLAAPAPDAAALPADASVVSDSASPADAAPVADAAAPVDQAARLDLALDREPKDTVPPVYAPGEVRGMVFWFDAAQGVSLGADGRVALWQDRSSAGFQARPVKVGPLLLDDAGNGRSAISFAPSGADTVLLRIPDDRSLNWNRDDFTVVAVLKHRNHSGPAGALTSYGMIYSKVLSEVPPYVGVQLYANDPWPSYLGLGPTRTGFLLQVAAYKEQGVASTIDGYDDDRVRLLVAMRRKRSFLLRVDGVEIGARSATAIQDIDTEGVPAVMGANPTRHEQQLVGELFELVGYRGPMLDEDLMALERYLLMKYGLAEFGARDR